MTRCVIFLLLAGCSSPELPAVASYTCDSSAYGDVDAHPRAAQYAGVVDAVLELGSPAVSVAIIDADGLWVGADGYADLRQAVPAEPCHRFFVASTTKMFTASTVLRLQEDGHLSLDDPAAMYLPTDVTQNVSNLGSDGSESATLRELLQHTSGIVDYLSMGYFLAAFDGDLRGASAAEELEWTYNRPAWFSAGSDLEYSNANYLLLSLVLERVTGESAYEAIREYVISPLELHSTAGRSEGGDSVVRGYADQHGNGVLVDHTELTEAVMGGEGKLDGGLVSTAADLATLVRSLATGGLLTTASTEQMHTVRVYEPGEDDGPEDAYGLGLARIQTAHGEGFGHYGTVYPYQTLAFHFPDHDTTVVITTNGSVGTVGDWINSEAPYDLIFADTDRE